MTDGAPRERELVVGGGPWRLPATLCLPSRRPAPGVLLVPGTGPSDRDLTVGQNRPFRDLAHGLAARGVASLRFDKRTFVHRRKVAMLEAPTLRDELLDDAVSAFRQLRAQPEVDGARCVLLGHSLGGTAVPRLAPELPAAAGFVILAGATVPLPDAIVRQLAYLAHDEARLQAARLERRQIANLERGLPGPTTRPLLGAPASFWLDLHRHDPVALAASMTRPVLVIAGGRDYQVTDEDLVGWRRGLAAHPRARILHFDDLDHLMRAGAGPSHPDQYLRPGRVDPRVVDAVADFVASLP